MLLLILFMLEVSSDGYKHWWLTITLSLRVQSCHWGLMALTGNYNCGYYINTYASWGLTWGMSDFWYLDNVHIRDLSYWLLQSLLTLFLVPLQFPSLRTLLSAPPPSTFLNGQLPPFVGAGNALAQARAKASQRARWIYRLKPPLSLWSLLHERMEVHITEQ